MSSRPSRAQIERARQYLEHEGERASGITDVAAAAGRVYEKLNAQLAPILGAAGVQALLVRSAKLTQSEFACLAAPGIAESPTNLREGLRTQPAPVAVGAAAAFFGQFFALLTTFIGERLSDQVLASAWPMMEENEEKEK